MKAKRLGYFLVTVAWTAEIYFLSLHIEQVKGAGVLFWIMVALAAKTAGNIIAFEKVGGWFRFPFVKEVRDSSGGDKIDLEAKEGPAWMEVIGELITCPFCAEVHAGTWLLMAYSLSPAFGWMITAVLSVATVAGFVYQVMELMCWTTRVKIEQQGNYWYDKHPEQDPRTAVRVPDYWQPAETAESRKGLTVN